MNEARTTPSASDSEFSPSIADTIYRPFFLAGIATVLTLGCMWGAINLLTIGVKKSFSSIEYSWVLAHGHAMVFGVVGFFIMGFAYQAFPRFKHTSLWRPRLAFSALPLTHFSQQPMKQKITGFEKDEEDHWRAILECGHRQHVRHDPPMTTRDWVLTPEGRDSRVGFELDCKRCDEEPDSLDD